MADILYADDDELFRQLVSSVLEGTGNTVRLVTDGTRAIEAVRLSPPDLILLDYRMGEPDGLAVCRQLKADPRYGHIPILILTAEGAIDQRLSGFDAGADDYLSKPFDPRELRARIRALLELTRRGLDRNPSSGLPGGEAIGREFDRRRGSDRDFAIGYLDLDNFKPFGERFGFAVSDGVIGEVGDLLHHAAQDSNTFAAHVGGDDFILFCDSDVARTKVGQVQRGLEERLPRHLPPEIAAAGRYTGKDRSGVEREFPLTALSAAILYIPAAYPESMEALGEIVSQAKDRAKREGSGKVTEIDLRGGVPER